MTAPQNPRVTDELRDECAAEWHHLLNKTFSTPMAVEHLAQFVLSHREAAEAKAKAREAALVEAMKQIIALCPNETGTLSTGAMAGLLFNIEARATAALTKELIA